MPAGITNCDDPSEADVVILGANYDRTSSFGKGADKGPSETISVLNRQIEFFEKYTETYPGDNLKISYVDMGNLNSMMPEDMVDYVTKNFDSHLSKGKFVTMLGGEHSLSNAPFLALSKMHNPKDVTIFQIDAHLDMRDTDEDYNDKPWGKYAHSAVMRRGAELGFPTVQVGIRAYAKEEMDFARKHGSKVFEWGNGKDSSLKDIIASIPTGKVYVTIDIDGIDPSHMPGTGTPVQGGLDWHFTMNLLQQVFQKKDVVGFDIVEIAPKQG
ncbi:MAG: agmatinase, partial [Candidatus Aenigmarchaeota archaeon]|nr:agmatinase [Candidatus Aenigmarchaeota archaeon]